MLNDLTLERDHSKSVCNSGECLITETTEHQKYCVIICIKKQRQSYRGVNQVSRDIVILEQNSIGAYYEQ